MNTYTGYQIYYQFFDQRSAAEQHISLPSYLATSSSFPAKVSQELISHEYKYDLVLYESISLQLLGIDEQAGGCDDTFIRVGKHYR